MSTSGKGDGDPEDLSVGDPRNLEQGRLPPEKIPPSFNEEVRADSVSVSYFREWIGEVCAKPYSFNDIFLQQIPDSFLTESKGHVK